jgi:capsular polysaccharide export protein
MPARRPRESARALTSAPRSFLFLQGPQSYFFERVARALIARGHRVQRINLNLGDRLFWRLPARDFRGRFEDWPHFVAALLEERGITDLLLLGDRRPYHIAAAEAARAHGMRVFATDLGHLRPGWLTLSEIGVDFPRDPDAIRTLAAEFPEPDLAPLTDPPFHLLAFRDIAYHVASVLGRPLYPYYRHHGLYHPFREYAGWVKNAPRRLLARRSTAAAKALLAAAPGSYFLFPLQLATDFQLRAHSPFATAPHALDAVLRSFAKSGAKQQLVIVAHPLDEGLINWRQLIGTSERVVFLEGGVTGPLVANAAGVVTVNSTVGLMALRHGIPVKPLGTAIYDIAGLTHAGGLAGFWHQPKPPDVQRLAAFLRALVGATQVKGGFHTREGQAAALPVFVERMEQAAFAGFAARRTMAAPPQPLFEEGR